MSMNHSFGIKVFAGKFLEDIHEDNSVNGQWDWKPANNATDVFASGAPTATQQSTYKDQRDNQKDSDRPNEGLKVV
ncbi:hypothetical protein CQA53_00105 [Helicobacter didelphidarum]|uniref:Uncharacterized protein n=1 Tax=Helicobacter didelphidarum TaxID=2040648 RepID=A0A3D8ISA5_9HELI|nr:hypothetical protein [Helicobacter didelphidarum]RDU67471.1 hypothetical protein CQA53_00105 [Helicobacter didelphidarum]